MYMFTWTTATTTDRRFISNMYMDDDIIASSFTAASPANQSTQIVFIHCESGARVYIQCGNEYNCQPYNTIAPSGLQTFAGFLVTADE